MKDACVHIYYGPKRDYEEKIPKDTEKITLTQLATMHDREAKKHLHVAQGQEPVEEIKDPIPLLVAYSDEYAGLSENAIVSFVNFLAQYEIEEIYLQNPPINIVEQIEKVNNSIDFLRFEYANINIEILKKINNDFSNNIIGQEKVKSNLLRALYPLCKASSKKPVVMLFYGPTGVGKTETAKYLSDILKQKLFRKQFSMFQNNDFASYLFGGSHSQNCFARDLLERESNIILIDEFDKPNPIFHSAFYQLFDEGVFEDKNYSVKVEKSIIICTSNYTSEEDIKSKLSPPIFSRFDSIVRFGRLSKKSIEAIMDNEFERQYKELEPEEKTYVDKYNLLEKAKQCSNEYENAREIRNLFKDALAQAILKEIL